MKQSEVLARHAWLEPYAQTSLFAPSFLCYVAYENEATTIQFVSNLFIPGLLQTQEYITALQALFPAALYQRTRSLKGKKFTDFRLERQWRVLENPQPPRLEIIVDEGVLRRIVGNHQIMYEQLMHLVEMAQLPTISFRILPSDATLTPFLVVAAASVTLLQFADERKSFLSIEQYLGDAYNTQNVFETASFTSEFILLQERAMDDTQSLAFLRARAQALLQPDRDSPRP